LQGKAHRKIIKTLVVSTTCPKGEGYRIRKINIPENIKKYFSPAVDDLFHFFSLHLNFYSVTEHFLKIFLSIIYIQPFRLIFLLMLFLWKYNKKN